ncbi:related to ankyrin 3 [Fusarium fujikuroi]|nr:related to ankyrin 3 [Fusarium fujikuroi]
MQSNTASGVWDSRFANTSDAAVTCTPASVSTGDSETDNILQDILMIVRNELPNIQPEFLKFDSRLGAGTSFEVNKELFGLTGEAPYFVAVKRLSMDRLTGRTKQTDKRVQQSLKRLINVKHEVRVFAHPKLRSHSCLITAIAWGWEPDLTFGNRPYLVMPYSPHGTLASFSQKRGLNLIDRRFLALDVAMGIRALHDCDIVHGDVKPDNVLVYGYLTRDKDEDRHYIAKLADFGCALFKQDFEQQHQYYLGTPRYNAPEICGWIKDTDEEPFCDNIPILTRYKAADCFSFGLVLWETITHAKSFIEPAWLKPGETALSFLERSFHTKENALLELAIEFLRSEQRGLDTTENKDQKSSAGEHLYPSNPTTAELNRYFGEWTQLRQGLDAIGAPPDSQSFQVFEATVSLCLQDRMSRRGDIYQIVEALSDGVDGNIPENTKTEKILPLEIKINGESPYLEDRYEKLLAPTMLMSPITRAVFLDKGSHSCSSSKNLQAVPRDQPADPSRQLIRVTARKRCETLILTPQAYQYKSEDMFKAISQRQPPWYNQCEAAKLIQKAIMIEDDPEIRSRAHLQMAMMFQAGYGVAPDSLEALSHLQAASKNNKVALAILNPVYAALKPGQQDADVSQVPIMHRNLDVFHDGVAWREDSGKEADQFINLGPISVESFKKFEILVMKGRFQYHELCEALTAACRDGNLNAAILLARQCDDLSHMDPHMPNALHWLVLFSQTEALSLLEIMVSGSEQTVKEERMKAVRSLLAAVHGQLKVLLPHRCMELQGTPLHWAVIAGYTKLVEEYLNLGADVNKRDEWRKTTHEDGYTEHTPSLSPLDLAVAGHYPDIVKLLISHGSETHGGDWHWTHSPFHMIGYNMLPFGRYVAHGQSHRAALRETIQILLQTGLDINDLDNLKQTPLFSAAKSMDLEEYVLEELIAAGALPGEECEKNHGNAVVWAIMDSAHRRLSWRKIPLLLPLVSDINACTAGDSGLNALHYCAVLDAVPAAQILLQLPGIDVEAESTLGATAVHLATQRGSLGVLDLLIKGGANLHRREPFEAAISGGQIDALRMLLDAGSKTWWKSRSGQSRTILGYAVRMRSQRPSYVRACLSKCPQLRGKEVINKGDDSGWTALHFCAYYGDLDGIQALVDYDADVDVVNAMRQTPLQLAVKTYEDLTVYLNGVPHFTDHPRIFQDIDGLERWSQGYIKQAQRIEISFKDSLFEIIRVLQQAEREKHPGRAVKEVTRGLGKVQTEVITTQKEVRNHHRSLAFTKARLERYPENCSIFEDE